MVDCRYQMPYVADLSVPTVVVNNDTMKELIRWFVTHLIRSQVAERNVAAHFIMDWYGMNLDTFVKMTPCIPE